MSNCFQRSDLQTMRSRSRTFLVVLLAATITCIVLLQVTLDSWAVEGDFNLQFNLTNGKKDEAASPQPKPLKILNSKMAFTTITATSIPVVVPKMTEVPAILQINSIKTFRTKSSYSLTQNKLHLQGYALPDEVKYSYVRKNRPTVVMGKGNHSVFVDKQMALRAILKRSDVKLRPKGDPVKAIRSMPVVSPEKVTRVFLLTYFRSGSSFLGDLLQQNWKTFYQFEPFHYMGYGNRITENQTEEAFSLLNAIYRCNFTNFEYYLNWTKQPQNKFLFANSLFLWFSCRTYTDMCFTPSFVSAVCSRALYQVVKAPRLSMSQMKRFLQENPDLNIKLVYLSRDPRGILSSRWSLDWCSISKGCADPKLLCAEMEEDMSLFNELQQSDPSKFIRVRYEDIVKNPKEEAAKLLGYLGLPFSSTVQRFIKSHTIARKAETGNPYSTKRNSSSMAYSWRQRIDFRQASFIQSSCSTVITALNFSLITSPEELEQSNKTKSLRLGKNATTPLSAQSEVYLGNTNKTPRAYREIIPNKNQSFKTFHHINEPERRYETSYAPSSDVKSNRFQ